MMCQIQEFAVLELVAAKNQRIKELKERAKYYEDLSDFLQKECDKYADLENVTSHLLQNLDQYGIRVVRDMGESIEAVRQALAALDKEEK